MALDAQRREQLLDRCARQIGKVGLTAPAILFLEAYKPLAFLGAQALWVSQPFLSALFNPADLHDFALVIQDPAGTEDLLARLETLQLDDSASRSQHRT